jgi:putative radical SAM enzyme (TIGR03279 family)
MFFLTMFLPSGIVKQPMVRITAVEKDSPAARAGFAAGDELETINGRPVEDFLDFLFLSSEAELKLAARPAGGGKLRRRTIVRSSGESLGLEIDQGRIAHCGCNCTFCFVRQLPRGLRRSLYVKDEDYRHSFLYGNYITGSNLSAHDLERIGELGLSPLYISVHATDPQVRKRMLGGRGRADIIELLDELLELGIEVHTQVVLCPGINDGPVLERTVRELEALGEEILSLAVVPVGLTDHRARLPRLDAVSPEIADRTLRQIHALQREFRETRGGRFVFAADEFYLLSGRRLPGAASYEGYPQIENGVGLVRSAIRELDRVLPRVSAESWPQGLKINVLTGKSFAPVFRERLLPKIDKLLPAQWRVAAVENRLLGNRITVAGLICGRDFLAAARENPPADIYLLPDEARNNDGKYLDDWELDDIRRELAPARVISALSPAEAVKELAALTPLNIAK